MMHVPPISVHSQSEDKSRTVDAQKPRADILSIRARPFLLGPVDVLFSWNGFCVCPTSQTPSATFSSRRWNGGATNSSRILISSAEGQSKQILWSCCVAETIWRSPEVTHPRIVSSVPFFNDSRYPCIFSSYQTHWILHARTRFSMVSSIFVLGNHNGARSRQTKRVRQQTVQVPVPQIAPQSLQSWQRGPCLGQGRIAAQRVDVPVPSAVEEIVVPVNEGNNGLSMRQCPESCGCNSEPPNELWMRRSLRKRLSTW